MDGHYLSEGVTRIIKSKKLDAVYVRKLSAYLLSVCEPARRNVFFDLDDPVISSLNSLAELNPGAVWDEIARLLTDESPQIRRQVSQLLVRTHVEKYLEHGIAVNIPAAILLNWVRGAPEERAAIAINWLPVTQMGDNDVMQWHPEMMSFVSEFGSHPGVLPAIERRLYPTSFWGSLVRYLEPLIPVVETWTKHPKLEIRQFANGLLVRLHRDIAAEQKRDEEDTVPFG